MRDRARQAAYMRNWLKKNAIRVNKARRARLKNDPVFAAKMRAHDRARYLRYRKDQRYRKIGISLDQYYELCAIQQNACAICGRCDQPLVADHCHITGKFRALLCRSCNSLLGWYENYQVQIKRVLMRKTT